MVSLEPAIKSVIRAYSVGFVSSYASAVGTAYLAPGSSGRARATAAGVSMVSTSSAVLVNDWMRDNVTTGAMVGGVVVASLLGYGMLGTDTGTRVLDSAIP